MRQRATAQTSIANRGRASLSAQVAALFASLGSTPKLWLDPSDPAARFQDQAGTTLVTADGQPYGRANDKSGGGNHVGQVTTTSRPLWRTDGTLSWAQPDGIDDFWQSLANFDCSSTNSVTVVAGVRKLSDAATALLMEISALADTTPGTFAILAPSSTGANKFVSRVTGSSGVAVDVLTTSAAFSAPISAVVTTAAQLGLLNSLRVNGVSVAAPAVPSGGNFGNFLLNLFRRNGATLPFSGSLYGLMIIGRLLTADELSLCERYMAQKSGVTL